MTQHHVHAFVESKEFPAEEMAVVRVEGRERIGELFRFEIRATCRDGGDLAPASFAGSDAELVFQVNDAEVRRVRGVISEVVDRAEPDSEERTVVMTLVPQMARLGLVETQEIFLDQSVTSIVFHKLQLVGLDHAIEKRLVSTYPSREFVVEYKETDLAFSQRLLEHVGVSYMFLQDAEQDRIVFTDHKEGFPKLEADIRVRSHASQDAPCIGIEVRTKIVPSVFMVRDYNYRTPHLDLSASENIEAYAGGVVEFGGHFKTPDEAKQLAKVRAEERKATQSTIHGTAVTPAIAAGFRAKLVGHPRLGDLDVLFVEVTHLFERTTAMGSEGNVAYTSTFHAISANDTYRPPRVTPRPRIDGVVTAIIDGEGSSSSGYAKIDEQGRYLVRFLFDSARKEQRSSRPVRMAQPHVGPDYGMHFPLKPGVEVIVAFIDGDPDRPIIVGAVPNPTVPSPVTARHGNVNRLRTSSGVTVEMHDGTPRSGS